jgi:hypothetical protein
LSSLVDKPSKEKKSIVRLSIIDNILHFIEN